MISAPLAPYLAFVRRHRWSYLAALLVAILGTVFYLLTTPVRYRAAATTIVPYREIDADLRFSNGRPFPVQYSFVVNNHLEVLRGASVKAAILEAIRRDAPELLEDLREEGVSASEIDPGRALLRQLDRSLRASSRDKTGVLRVEAVASTAERAARLANLALETYSTVQDSLNRQTVREWLANLVAEEQRWAEELSRREEDLREFRGSENVMNLIEETRALINEMIRMRGQIATADGDRRAMDASLSLRRQQLNTVLEAFEESVTANRVSLVTELREQLAQDDARLVVLQSMGDGASSQAARLNERIVKAREALGSEARILQSDAELQGEPTELAELLLRIVRDLDTELDGREARVERLQASLDSLEERYRRLPALALLEDRHERERDLAEEVFKLVHQRRVEAQVNAESSASRLTAINPAEPPERAASPRRLLALASALLLTVLAGTGAGIVVEGLDPTLRDAEEAARITGLSLLARPASEGGARVGPDAAAAAAVVRALAQGGAVWLLHPEDGPNGDLARSVAQRLEQMGVTSIRVSEGGLDGFLNAAATRQVGAVILIGRSRHHRRAALRDVADLIRSSGVPCPGLIVL